MFVVAAGPGCRTSRWRWRVSGWGRRGCPRRCSAGMWCGRCCAAVVVGSVGGGGCGAWGGGASGAGCPGGGGVSHRAVNGALPRTVFVLKRRTGWFRGAAPTPAPQRRRAVWQHYRFTMLPGCILGSACRDAAREQDQARRSVALALVGVSSLSISRRPRRGCPPGRGPRCRGGAGRRPCTSASAAPRSSAGGSPPMSRADPGISWRRVCASAAASSPPPPGGGPPVPLAGSPMSAWRPRSPCAIPRTGSPAQPRGSGSMT